MLYLYNSLTSKKRNLCLNLLNLEKSAYMPVGLLFMIIVI